MLEKLPRLDPVTGEMAVPSALENAEPPAVMTPEVLAFFETRTAMIATPTIAVKTVTTELTSDSDID